MRSLGEPKPSGAAFKFCQLGSTLGLVLDFPRDSLLQNTLDSHYPLEWRLFS